jgi:dephospho-CoA kinase
MSTEGPPSAGGAGAGPYRAPGPRGARRSPAADGCYVVGLTGGMASGKSTVARVLAASGARLIEADRLGHDVLEAPEARSALAAAFGPAVLDASGRVRRAEVARLAFASPQALARLNAISHPRLLAAARGALDEVLAGGLRGVVALEAALLVEWDLGAWCDEVVAVVAPAERRREWAAGAHGLTPEQAEARFALQLPDAERVRYADRVVANDGSLADLERRARELADALWSAWRSRQAPEIPR